MAASVGERGDDKIWHASGDLALTKVANEINHGCHSSKSRSHTWLGNCISYVYINCSPRNSTYFIYRLTEGKVSVDLLVHLKQLL